MPDSTHVHDTQFCFNDFEEDNRLVEMRDTYDNFFKNANKIATPVNSNKIATPVNAVKSETAKKKNATKYIYNYDFPRKRDKKVSKSRSKSPPNQKAEFPLMLQKPVLPDTTPERPNQSVDLNRAYNRINLQDYLSFYQELERLGEFNNVIGEVSAIEKEQHKVVQTENKEIQCDPFDIIKNNPVRSKLNYNQLMDIAAKRKGLQHFKTTSNLKQIQKTEQVMKRTKTEQNFLTSEIEMRGLSLNVLSVDSESDMMLYPVNEKSEFAVEAVDKSETEPGKPERINVSINLSKFLKSDTIKPKEKNYKDQWNFFTEVEPTAKNETKAKELKKDLNLKKLKESELKMRKRIESLKGKVPLIKPMKKDEKQDKAVPDVIFVGGKTKEDKKHVLKKELKIKVTKFVPKTKSPKIKI